MIQITEEDWVWAQSALDFQSKQRKETMTDINTTTEIKELPIYTGLDGTSIVPEGESPKLDADGNPINPVVYVQVAEDVGDESILASSDETIVA